MAHNPSFEMKTISKREPAGSGSGVTMNEVTTDFNKGPRDMYNGSHDEEDSSGYAHVEDTNGMKSNRIAKKLQTYYN